MHDNRSVIAKQADNAPAACLPCPCTDKKNQSTHSISFSSKISIFIGEDILNFY